ncbi:MAG: MFS transporter [Bacteroidales bacterium]|nr:MFS transporter [Bacteroidales bacterium]
MTQSTKNTPPVWLRWLVLLVVSVAMMGNYYIYDSISPLADLLKQQLGFSDAAIGTLNAIYSLPNVIMVLIGGIIIDRIGIRKAGFIFSFLIMAGALLTWIGGSLTVMAAGRLVFGLGAESMIVAITTSIARWFKGKEFALAFGLNLTIARLGSFMALNSPSWARELYDMGWQYPLIISAVAGTLALLCISLYSLIDYFSEKRYDLPKEGNTDKIELKKVFQFPVSFWFISSLCVVFYSAMFPFQTFAVKFFQHVHHTTRDAGGLLSSILTLSAMVFTPIFGALSDKVGRRASLMLIGSILIVPVYLLMGYGANISGWLNLPETLNIKFSLLDIDAVIPTNLFIPMSMMGLAFSLVPAVMWPSVAYVVDSSKLGTAYGLMTMIQNIGLFVFNLMIGLVNDAFAAGQDNPQGYIPGMWIFSVCGFLGIILAILLRRYAPALEKAKQ